MSTILPRAGAGATTSERLRLRPKKGGSGSATLVSGWVGRLVGGCVSEVGGWVSGVG